MFGEEPAFGPFTTKFSECMYGHRCGGGNWWMVRCCAVLGTLPNDERAQYEPYYPFQIINTDLVPFDELRKLAQVFSRKSWIPWNPPRASSNLSSQPK